MLVVQHRCEPVQLLIAKSFRLDRLDRGQHIIPVDAGLAVALQHVAQLLGRRQPAGILHMAAIDDIDQRADALPRLVLQPHRSLHLAVDRSDLFTLAQIGDGGRAVPFGGELGGQPPVTLVGRRRKDHINGQKIVPECLATCPIVCRLAAMRP